MNIPKLMQIFFIISIVISNSDILPNRNVSDLKTKPSSSENQPILFSYTINICDNKYIAREIFKHLNNNNIVSKENKNWLLMRLMPWSYDFCENVDTLSKSSFINAIYNIGLNRFNFINDDDTCPRVMSLEYNGFSIEFMKVHHSEAMIYDYLSILLEKKEVDNIQTYNENVFSFFELEKKTIKKIEKSALQNLLLFIESDFCKNDIELLFDFILKLKKLPSFIQTNRSSNILFYTKIHKNNTTLEKYKQTIIQKNNLMVENKSFDSITIHSTTSEGIYHDTNEYEEKAMI